MNNLSWQAVEFVLDAVAQNTAGKSKNEEALFVIGLIVAYEKGQLNAAPVEEVKTWLSAYGAAFDVPAT